MADNPSMSAPGTSLPGTRPAAGTAPGGGRNVPGWLVPAVIAVGVLATVTALASLAVRREAVFAAALGAGIIAGSLAPAVASAGLVASHESAFDTPFEPARAARAVDSLPLLQAQVNLLIPRLELVQEGAPDLMAVQTAAVAAFFSSSGQEVLPIGGFTGTIPSPTLSQLQADIRAGRFHLVWIATTDDPRLKWIATHCIQQAKRYYWCGAGSGGPRPVGKPIGTVTVTPVGTSVATPVGTSVATPVGAS
jgi:hypothetical protein